MASATHRLSGEAFEGSQDLDVDRLQRLFISRRADIKNKLVSEEEINAEGFSPLVATTLRIDFNGEPTESYFNVITDGPFRKQKFPASRIFTICASRETKIVLDKLDLSLFNFGASANHSDWINASSFGLTFQKKNSRDHGVYPSNEWSAQGLGDFALKLVVEATEAVGVAHARVVALPLPMERLGDLPGGCAKDISAYPVIDVFSKSWEVSMLPQNTEPIRGDSLPVLPLLLFQGPPGEDPSTVNTGKIYRAMYAVWSNMAGVRGCTAEYFNQLTSASTVDVSAVPAEWAWPQISLPDDNDDTLGESYDTQTC